MSGDLLGNATFSAVVGGLAGSVTSWFISISSERSGRRYARFDSIELLIDDLQCVSRRYWKKAGSDSVQELEIKGVLERLDLKIQSLLRLIGKPSVECAINEYMDKLTDEVTGGDFESVKRRRDSVRVMKIEGLCDEIKSYLHDRVR